MGNDVDVLDGAVRHQEPMLDLPIVPVARHAVEQALEKPAIVGMGSLDNEIDDGRDARIALENAIGLGRPADFAGVDPPTEASRKAQPLGFREIGLVSPQGTLGPLAVLDIGVGSIPLDDVALLVAQWRGTIEEPAILP